MRGEQSQHGVDSVSQSEGKRRVISFQFDAERSQLIQRGQYTLRRCIARPHSMLSALFILPLIMLPLLSLLDKSVAFAATAIPTPTVTSTGAGNNTQFFAASSPWNVPIGTNVQLDPASSTMVSRLTSGLHVPALFDYGMPIYSSTASDPSYTVNDPGNDPLFEKEQPIHIPDAAAPSPGSDHWLFIYDQTKNLLFEMWQAQKKGNTWSTNTGNVYSPTGDGVLQIDGSPQSGNGGSYFGGVITDADIARGSINHALSLASQFTSSSFRYPMVASDGKGGVIPMGARLQLDPSVDCSGLPGASSGEKMVCQALQTYGGYMRDTGGVTLSMYFEGEDLNDPNRNPPNGSPGNPGRSGGVFGAVGLHDGADLSAIPWNKLRVLKSWNSFTALAPSNTPVATGTVPATSTAIAPVIPTATDTVPVTPTNTVPTTVPVIPTDTGTVPATPTDAAPVIPTATDTVPTTPTATNTASTTPTATSTASTQPTNMEPVGQAGNWKLLFHDEFNGSSLDTNVWRTCYPNFTVGNDCTHDQNEMELYQPSGVSVANGTLNLEAQKQDVTASNGTTYHYTSGMITTGPSAHGGAATFTFTHGYMEMRAQVPAGQGLWPAFWTLPADGSWPPEIDVFEILGNAPGVDHMTYHWSDGSDEGAQKGGEWNGQDFSAGWHTFAVDWEPNAITWFVDGVQRFQYTNVANIYNKPMYLVANLAVGGDWPGNPDGTTHFPAQYQIDYIRVWQK